MEHWSKDWATLQQQWQQRQMWSPSEPELPRQLEHRRQPARHGHPGRGHPGHGHPGHHGHPGLLGHPRHPGHRGHPTQRGVRETPPQNQSQIVTVPREGSAFRQVVSSRTDNSSAVLLSRPSSSDSTPEIKVPYTTQEVKYDLTKDRDVLLLTDKEAEKDSEASDDSKASSENVLPFKKRRAFYSDPESPNSKMGDVTKDSLCDSYGFEEQALTCSDNDKHHGSVSDKSLAHQSVELPPHSPSGLCKCMQLAFRYSSVENCGGYFRDWKPVQVQLWLWRVLSTCNINMQNICCLLHLLEGKDGSALATFSREDWKRELGDCGVPSDLVWGLVCKKIKSDGQARTSEFLKPTLGRPTKPVKPNQFSEPNDLVKYESKTDGMRAVAVSPASQKIPKRLKRRRNQCVGQLWEFIFGLLMNPATNPSVICWEDESKRLFRIVNTETIARLWGKHKGNEKMTYANMSRTMRYYQSGNGAFVRNERKRVYGFGPKANFEKLCAKLTKKLTGSNL